MMTEYIIKEVSLIHNRGKCKERIMNGMESKKMLQNPVQYGLDGKE
jgi:hypothetical protein